MSEKPGILFVEDDPAVLTTFSAGLEAEGYPIETATSTQDALERLAQRDFPIVVTDIYIDERTGLDVLRAARDYNPECAVIVITGQGTMETVMQATERGAFEYLAKPFDLSRLLETLQRAEQKLFNGDSPKQEPIEIPPTEMVGFAPEMIEVYKTVSRAAPTEAPVLILGESGTGKELVARLLHRHSKRAHGPFIAVDCGSVAPGVIESELFGAVRGAYTGADRDRAGLFEAANGGTVFLDEIGEVDAGFQLKLLRFLQEREIRPLGSSRSKKLDVRVVAATHRNLPAMIEEGEFRQDLWFRLNVVEIRLPALRERRSDIPPLVQHFLERFAVQYGRKMQLSPAAMRVVSEHPWPGNVRQLQHVLERLVILQPGETIDEDAVSEALRSFEPREKPVESLADAEEEQIRKVLAATGGNKTRAAKILNIERKTLYRKLEKMGL